MFNTRAQRTEPQDVRAPPPLSASVLYSGFFTRMQTEPWTAEWQRHSQLGEPRQLEGFDGDLADAVATQPQDLQAGTQVVQRSEFQRADFVVA